MNPSPFRNARPSLVARPQFLRGIALFLAAAALVLLVGLGAAPAHAATSTQAVGSPMAGNGHNISFDGRLFIARRGPDNSSGGWFATILRPENVVASNGFVDLGSGAFSDWAHIKSFEAALGENALAICEADSSQTPFDCDEAGNANPAGPHACYDVFTLDSNAYGDPYTNELRRRHLKLWVKDPHSPQAAVHKWEWVGGTETLTTTSGGLLRGIEPTVTRDGKLMIWQGHPDNDGKIDILMYATNDTPCGVGAWHGPHDVSQMVHDNRVHGVYPIAERAMRAADGDVFREAETIAGFEIREADSLHGAYPWLFPDGDAVIFTSVVVPCRSENDPPGCGPRRGGIAVFGYPTNWGVAHVDGAVNPNTDDTVRLFFSSPGPTAFGSLPITEGLDVWPFFGSNTQNYTEIVFDDGLDGQYAGVWHMNESVTRDGNLDLSRTPDTSGYFNTGQVVGASFTAANNGPVGKALLFDGTSSRVTVAHSSTLLPVNGITLEMWLRPDSPVDCDANNNYRVLLQKGDFASGAYSLVLEEGGLLHARIKTNGTVQELWSDTPLVPGTFSQVAFAYQGATGLMAFTVDGALAGQTEGVPGTLDTNTDPLHIGNPGFNTAACPTGGGSFHGAIEEVRISRVDRIHPPPANDPPDAGPPPPADDGGGSDPGPVDAGTPDPDPDPDPDPETPDAGTVQGNGGSNGGAQDSNPDGQDDPDPASEQNPAQGADGCRCIQGTPQGWGGPLALGFLILLGANGRKRRRG
jgi:hypothetical protein